MAGFEPGQNKKVASREWPPTVSAHSATRLLAWHDLNKLFNIDTYCLSIDIWFTATIVNFLHSADRRNRFIHYT